MEDIIEIIFKYGKFIIFVLGVTSIIPIILYILLVCTGFNSSGIRLDSDASLWMSSIGNVESGSTFSIMQSISTWGIFLFLNPYMLIIECIFSLTLGIFIVYIYDFDIDKINKNIELLIPYVIKIINSIVSIVIDGFIGFLISIFVIFILYLLFLMFSKIINYIKKNKNIRLDEETGGQNHNNNNNNDNINMKTPKSILILLGFIFIIISIIFCIYLGYKYPFEIIKH